MLNHSRTGTPKSSLMLHAPAADHSPFIPKSHSKSTSNFDAIFCRFWDPFPAPFWLPLATFSLHFSSQVARRIDHGSQLLSASIFQRIFVDFWEAQPQKQQFRVHETTDFQKPLLPFPTPLGSALASILSPFGPLFVSLLARFRSQMPSEIDAKF